MKKTYEIVGREGKGNGRARSEKDVAVALQRFLEQHRRQALNFACGLCRDRGEAEELLQEACYRALKAGKRYQHRKPIKSWLFTILHNAFVDSRRRAARVPGLDYQHDEEGGDFLHELVPRDEEEILERLEREETMARVRMVLSRLKRKQREVLKLRDAEGLTYEATARTLRLTGGTVRSRLSRAREKFRRLAVVYDLG